MIRKVLLPLIGVFSLCCSLFLPNHAAAQPANCLPSDVLLVVDNSGSMQSSTSNGQTRWAATQGAYRTLLTQYAGKLRFGLITFESAATLRVPLASNTAQQCLSVLNSLGPAGTTAMRCALDIAYQHYSSAVIPADPVKDRRRFVVLMTDGEPNTCGTDVTPPIRNLLSQLNVKTYVIGFGSGVGAGTLQSMAVAGGTGQFYRADNQNDLFKALNDIANGASREICDGKDNDCDGVIDNFEDTCQGQCGAGKRKCVAGQWSKCSTDVPTGPEVCDNQDNDCNGKIDDGLTRNCSTACGAGVETCVAGKWSGCTAPSAKPEECNGKDDDCDGQIDEGLSRKCNTPCGEGVQACIRGDWTTCSAPQPQPEVCDGLDNNCNGKIDDGAVCQNGVCLNGKCVKTCTTECAGGYVCNNGFCEPRECATPCKESERCLNGSCVPNNCTLQGAYCAADEICRNGVCQRNLCPNIQCASGQFCRPYDNKCHHSCEGVQCANGEYCENGTCIKDPCAGVQCPQGQACSAGACQVPAACPAGGCPSGQKCEIGQCLDDPCFKADCPQGQTCFNGNCYGSNIPKPDGTPNPGDGGPNPNPDDPNNPNPDDPNNPKNPDDPNNPNNSDDPNNADDPNNNNRRGGTGCVCSSHDNTTLPLSLLLLFLLWPVLVRRRQQA
ncbi:VWA domain-containing protein [Myxococcota bacterium]|nr:VWA domain-containing protein [Myxococcota bacterium]